VLVEEFGGAGALTQDIRRLEALLVERGIDLASGELRTADDSPGRTVAACAMKGSTYRRMAAIQATASMTVALRITERASSSSCLLLGIVLELMTEVHAQARRLSVALDTVRRRRPLQATRGQGTTTKAEVQKVLSAVEGAPGQTAGWVSRSRRPSRLPAPTSSSRRRGVASPRSLHREAEGFQALPLPARNILALRVNSHLGG
jgi:hypothetical protein